MRTIEEKALAARIREIVKTSGGQKKVSAASGVKLGTLNNYMRLVSRPKLVELKKLASTCGCSLDWLTTGNRIAPINPQMGAARDAMTEEDAAFVRLHQDMRHTLEELIEVSREFFTEYLRAGNVDPDTVIRACAALQAAELWRDIAKTDAARGRAPNAV